MYGYAGFRQSIPFGWEKDADGLRGHVVSLFPFTFPRSELSISVSLYALRPLVRQR